MIKNKWVFICTLISSILFIGCAGKPLNKQDISKLIRDSKVYNEYNEYHFLPNNRYINVYQNTIAGRWFIGSGWVSEKYGVNDMLCVAYNKSVDLGDNYKIGDDVLCNRIFKKSDEYTFEAAGKCVTHNKDDIECDWRTIQECRGFKAVKENR